MSDTVTNACSLAGGGAIEQRLHVDNLLTLNHAKLIGFQVAEVRLLCSEGVIMHLCVDVDNACRLLRAAADASGP